MTQCYPVSQLEGLAMEGIDGKINYVRCTVAIEKGKKKGKKE